MQPAYSALDASVGVRRDHYDVSLCGHNLINANDILSIQKGIIYAFGNVFKTQMSTPPRTVGIDLKVGF